MQKPIKKYCELCGAPIVPEYKRWNKKVWYYPKRCPKCSKKRTRYKRHFLPGFHGKSKPEGSKFISKEHYVMIKHNGRWKREHRIIMEKILGRPLLRSEIVHHVNKNSLDNRPENLKLCSSVADHWKYHSKKYCSIPGCIKPHVALGYCGMHYAKFRKYGDPLHKKTRDICSIKGCGRKHKALGYCGMHYDKFKKYGDPLYRRKQKTFCSVEGCTKPRSSHGYCGMHYSRLKRHGDPLYKTKQRLFCLIEGCGNKHYALGYCKKHYQRFKNHGDPLYKKAQQLHTSPLIVK